MLGLQLGRKDIGLFVLMATVTFILYYPSLNYEFIHSLDDDWLIRDNLAIQDFSWRGLYNIFFVHLPDFHYHPITYVSYMLDYELFGLNPMGYKVHNLLLHIACGGVMYLFLMTLTKNRFVSFFTTFIFLIHPVNMESIVWASCRRQSLFYLYLLISLYFYLQSCLRSNKGFYFIAALFFAIIASLTKVTAIVFPLLFLLLSFVINKKVTKSGLIHLFIALPIVIFIFLINENINEVKFVKRTFDYSLFSHTVFYGYSYFFYWVKTFALYPQGVFYPAPSEMLTILPIKYYLYATASVFILLLHFYHFKKKEFLYLFSLLYFSISIFAMLNLLFFPVGDMPILGANRYFYHSCLGIFLYLGLWLDRLFSDKTKMFILVISISLCVYFFRTQLPVWQNSISLMANTVKYYPSEEIMYRLAIDLYKEGEKVKAFEYIDQADNLGLNIWINNDWYYYCQRAYIYFEKGDYKRALNDLNTAKSKDPNLLIFKDIIDNLKQIKVDSTDAYYKEIMMFNIK